MAIENIIDLRIRTGRNPFTLRVVREILEIDYTDENGEKRTLRNLTHERNLSTHSVENDPWVKILEDWLEDRPASMREEERAEWTLLEDYLRDASDRRLADLVERRNAIYEPNEVQDLLLRALSLSELGRATLMKCLKTYEDADEVYQRLKKRNVYSAC